MAELQSIVSSPWAAATPVQAAVAAPWNAAAQMQSIGSAYTTPAAPVGSVNLGDEPSLAARTEIAPATAYRSDHTPVLRNVRAIGDPLRYMNAPLTASTIDLVSPAATTSATGTTPTFSGAGMLSSGNQWVYYDPVNTKLNSSTYAVEVGLRYRVRVENLTSMPPPFNSSLTRFFTLNGLSHQLGFSIGTGGEMFCWDYHGTTLYPFVSLGIIPTDSVLSIEYPAGSSVGELRINGTLVYTSQVSARFTSGITMGLQSFVAISSLRFSALRMERIAAATDGLYLEDGTVIPATNGSVDLPDGSAMWRLSALIPRADYDTMRAGVQPPLVSLALAGRTWVFAVDEMSAPRAFASTDVSIRGVSLAALADAPYELSRQWTSDAPTTAAQIATLAQTFTGLTVSWQLPDWPVPAGGWSFAGSPWGAVLQAAAPAQAVVEAHPSALSVTVTSRYPVMPAEWYATAPDVQVSWNAVESESAVAADQPLYTGVFVTGPGASIASVHLAGTSGAAQAPLVTHDLLTDLDGQAERGRVVLAASGGAQTVTRVLPVLFATGQPGVIDRGALVRWVDPSETWAGMVRAVRVDWAFGVVRQTVACERRTSFPVGVAST